MQARWAVGAAALAAAAALALPRPERARPFGFARDTARVHLAMERSFLAQPEASRLRDTHQRLTSLPHPAGSARNRELADWIASEFRQSGMEDVGITAHDVLLPQPREVGVEMDLPQPWRATTREPPVAGEPDTALDPAAVGLPYHAYSASGDVTAPFVYAGDGHPADYDWLAARGIDVRGRIALVRYTTPYSYRGYKVFTAQQRGTAGVLIFSDPSRDGSVRGPVYPDGPWGPDGRIERGSVAFDFLAPGDPLTPGWASVPGAPRAARGEAPSLPTIVSAPLSAIDARYLLELLPGPAGPREWQGGLPIEYRAGPSRQNVRMRIRSDDQTRPVWTVTGLFRGSDSPDQMVVLGNHRDAWVYGGADPSTGTAALLELARSFGALARSGWRPRRSVLFASWDAEELALVSSTEWAEQYEARLRAGAVAYINVDSGVSGRRFTAVASPSLRRAIAEAAQAVRDPVARIPVAAAARELRSVERGIAVDGDGFIDHRVAGGSDYTVFLNFLGVPVADLAFDGPHGVYHSAYDTHQWVARYGDPGFQYHVALTQLWGIAALRLADADTLPLDPEGTAGAAGGFLREIEGRLEAAPGGSARADRLHDLRASIAGLHQSATAFNQARASALEKGDTAALRDINERLLTFERAFLDPDGLPGRTWFRHLLHAPGFTYRPQVLPGISDAIEARDERRLLDQIARLTAALNSAARRITLLLSPPPPV